VTLKCWNLLFAHEPSGLAAAGLVCPFFTSCKAMEFAEMEHRREEYPDLSVNLLIVLHILRLECERLECEKSMELTASSHHSCFFCCSRESRNGGGSVKGSPHWGSDKGARASRTFCPSMAHSSSDGHMGYIV